MFLLGALYLSLSSLFLDGSVCCMKTMNTPLAIGNRLFLISKKLH